MSKVPVHGILNVDKPSGMTSMEVVRRIKRLTRQRRVGHAGTLDPHATGVLPICFGQATRLMEYLVNSRKTYRAVLELGVSTDTYDSSGMVTSRRDFSSVTRDDMEGALESFKGTIFQVPPKYSALKKDGRRLYDLARSGIEVEIQPRKVQVFSLELVEWTPPLVTLAADCGRGIYVRSLAYDIGELLGCGAHLKDLVRLRSGPFGLSEAIALSDAENSLAQDTWPELLYPLDFVLRHLRAAVVGPKVEDLISHGRPIPRNFRIPFSMPQDQCRVYTTYGKFLAILTFDAARGHWQPSKVFSLGAAPFGSKKA